MKKTPEKEPRKEPAIVETQTVDVQLPQAGETLSAVIIKLGMSTAKEVYGEENVEGDPAQPMLAYFFANEEHGVKGRTFVPYYKHPTVKSKLFKAVRKWGQPRIGAQVQIVRDENGYWGLDL